MVPNEKSGWFRTRKPEGFTYVSGSVSIDDSGFDGTVGGSPGVGSTGDGSAGNPQIVTFTVGNVSVANDNDNTDDDFILELKAVVLDDPVNAATGSLQLKVNEAELTYTDMTGDPINDADAVSFAEPDLSLSMVISPDTDLDGEDLITVTLTLDNNGTGPAYDLTVTDNLDLLSDFLDLGTVSNTTASMGSWVFSQLGSVVSFDLGGTNSLAAGGQQVFTFTVELDDNVLPNTTYNNQASVSGDSNPGSPPEQRSDSDTASDAVTTDDPSIAKSISAVSPDGTGTGGTSVTAGDTVTYQITVTLTEGTTNNLIITDSLPEGFGYAGSATIDASGFNGTVTATPTIGTSSSVANGEVVSLDFGTVTTAGDNNTSNDAFVINLLALVYDDNANDGENSVQTKTNNVYLNTSTNGGTGISDSHTNNFAEPRVTINKVVSSNTVDAGDVITVELRVRNQGTAMAHDVVAFDTLDADLFDLSTVMLVDADGFNFSYVSPEVRFTKDTLTVAEGRRDLTFTVEVKSGVISGTSFTNVGQVIAETQTGDIPEERSTERQNTETINTTGIPALTKSIISSTDVNTSGTDVGIGEILTYQIAVTFPEGTTQENLSDPMITDTLPIGFQFIDAAFTGSSHSALISSVSDNVNGITTANLGNIGTTPVTFNNSFLGVSGTPATGQVLSFDVGDITNNDNLVVSDANDEQLIITYEVLVLNTTDNNAGNDKTNTVGLQYQDGDGNPLEDDASVTTTVKEPDLGMLISAAPSGGTASGMNTVTFTTQFFNSNTTDASTAYNLSFSDDLPDGYFGNSANPSEQPVVVSATYSADGSDISACFEWGGDGNELIFDATNGGCTLDSLDPGDTISIVYTAVIDSLTEFNETLTNNPTGEGTSLDGSTGNASSGGNSAKTADGDEGERTGSAANNTSGQAVNDLNTTASDQVTLAEPSLTKTGDTNLAIGDSTLMTISIDLPGGTAQNVSISDNLPAGLRYTADAVTITLPAGVFADTPNPTTAADDDPVVWNFGTITNTNSSNQSLTIQYEVEVRNQSGNQASTALNNTATLSFTGSSGGGNLDDQATVTVIEPNLTIEMEDGGGTYGAGSTIPYTIRIINAPGGATAYGVDFASILPPELLGGSADFYDNIVITNTNGSVVLTGTGTAVSGTDVSLGTATNAGDQLSLAAFDIPAGDSLIITFTSDVINNAVAGGDFDITAAADYNSLADDDSRGRDNSTDPGNVDDDNDADLNNYEESGSVNTSLSATMVIVKALNAVHSNNDFTIGDSVVYDLKVVIPEGVVNNVVVVDSLVAGQGFIRAVRSAPRQLCFQCWDE
ncbi:MAG: isopeptide-forming domain-containing fimbrial protein [Bacteroidota bacterium]